MRTLRDLRHDTDAFMMNVSGSMILGYVIMLVAMVTFWIHRMGWTDGNLFGTLWPMAPFIFAIGLVVVLVGWGFSDPKIILVAGGVAAVVWWLLFQAGA